MVDVMDIDLNSLGSSSQLNISFKDDSFSTTKDISIGGGGGSSGGGNGGMSMPTGFGPGLELLINDKKRNGFQSQASSVKDLGDLNALDRQMEELTGGNSGDSSKNGGNDFDTNGSGTNATKSGGGGFLGGLFSGWGGSGNIKTAKDVERSTQPDPASYVRPAPKTWDGFTKTAELPSGKAMYDSKQMSEKDKRIKKRNMIDELERWYEKGYIKDNLHFHRDTPYEEVEEEYDAVLEKIRRKKSINLQKDILYNVMNFIEFSNSWIDPFGLKLEGLADKTTEELDSYEDIFGELYDKWKGGKVPPELALLCKVGFSIAMLHMSNNVLSSTPIAFQDVVKQSPELQRAWHESVVKTMSETNDSDGMGFITSILQNQMVDEEKPDKRYGAPPATMDPRTLEPVSKPMPSAGKSMMFTAKPRPDMEAARGGAFPSTMFRESGVDIGQNYGSMKDESTPILSGGARPEMRGPRTNIQDLLSGLKPLPSVGGGASRGGGGGIPRPGVQPYVPPVEAPVIPQPPVPAFINSSGAIDDIETKSVVSNGSRSGTMGDSMISGGGMLESMMSLEDAGTLQGVSKRRKRKPRSDKNLSGGDDAGFGGSGFTLEISDI
jgi:hypothetical protein